MVNRGEVWNTCQPILNTLPGLFEAYTENEPTKVLVDYWDELYCGTKTKIDELPTQLNPLTCDEKYLPYLGYITGFSGNYSILNFFDTECQRQIISRSHSFIWKNKASKPVLDFLLDCLNIDYELDTVENFIIGTNVIGDPVGSEGEELTNFYVVPNAYTRLGFEWTRLQTIIDLFTPIWAEHQICYEHFVIGASAIGEPIFD